MEVLQWDTHECSYLLYWSNGTETVSSLKFKKNNMRCENVLLKKQKKKKKKVILNLIASVHNVSVVSDKYNCGFLGLISHT